MNNEHTQSMAVYIFQKWHKYFYNAIANSFAVINMPISGGATFCAVASLSLMGELESVLSHKERERLVRWCVSRQKAGFQGRTNKQPNASYCFWLAAALKVHIIFSRILFLYVE